METILYSTVVCMGGFLLGSMVASAIIYCVTMMFMIANDDDK